MQEKLICPFCGKAFATADLDSYSEHIQNCVITEKDKRKKAAEEQKAKAQKLNTELTALKKAKQQYESLREDFMEKYPDEYRLNFPESSCACNGNCHCQDETEDEESIFISDDDVETLTDILMSILNLSN